MDAQNDTTDTGKSNESGAGRLTRFLFARHASVALPYRGEGIAEYLRRCRVQGPLRRPRRIYRRARLIESEPESALESAFDTLEMPDAVPPLVPPLPTSETPAQGPLPAHAFPTALPPQSLPQPEAAGASPDADNLAAALPPPTPHQSAAHTQPNELVTSMPPDEPVAIAPATTAPPEFLPGAATHPLPQPLPSSALPTTPSAAAPPAAQPAWTPSVPDAASQPSAQPDQSSASSAPTDAVLPSSPLPELAPSSQPAHRSEAIEAPGSPSASSETLSSERTAASPPPPPAVATPYPIEVREARRPVRRQPSDALPQPEREPEGASSPEPTSSPAVAAASPASAATASPAPAPASASASVPSPPASTASTALVPSPPASAVTAPLSSSSSATSVPTSIPASASTAPSTAMAQPAPPTDAQILTPTPAGSATAAPNLPQSNRAAPVPASATTTTTATSVPISPGNPHYTADDLFVPGSTEARSLSEWQARLWASSSDPTDPSLSPPASSAPEEPAPQPADPTVADQTPGAAMSQPFPTADPRRASQPTPGMPGALGQSSREMGSATGSAGLSSSASAAPGMSALPAPETGRVRRQVQAHLLPDAATTASTAATEFATGSWRAEEASPATAESVTKGARPATMPETPLSSAAELKLGSDTFVSDLSQTASMAPASELPERRNEAETPRSSEVEPVAARALDAQNDVTPARDTPAAGSDAHDAPQAANIAGKDDNVSLLDRFLATFTSGAPSSASEANRDESARHDDPKAEEEWGGLPPPWQPLPLPESFAPGNDTRGSGSRRNASRSVQDAEQPIAPLPVAMIEPASSFAHPVRRIQADFGAPNPAAVTGEPDIEHLARRVYALLKRKIEAERRRAM
jgi:hypothetical protein